MTITKLLTNCGLNEIEGNSDIILVVLGFVVHVCVLIKTNLRYSNPSLNCRSFLTNQKCVFNPGLLLKMNSFEKAHRDCKL